MFLFPSVFHLRLGLYRWGTNERKNWYRTEGKTLSGGSVMQLGPFCWHGLGPLALSQRRVKSIKNGGLSDHLYLLMKHCYPDGSGFFQDDHAPDNP